MEYALIWGFKSCLCGVEHGRRRSQEEAGRPSEDGEKQRRRELEDVEWVRLGA